MNREEAGWQVDAMRDFVRRGGSMKQWFRSKDFSCRDVALILEVAYAKEPGYSEALSVCPVGRGGA